MSVQYILKVSFLSHCIVSITLGTCCFKNKHQQNVAAYNKTINFKAPKIRHCSHEHTKDDHQTWPESLWWGTDWPTHCSPTAHPAVCIDEQCWSDKWGRRLLCLYPGHLERGRWVNKIRKKENEEVITFVPRLIWTLPPSPKPQRIIYYTNEEWMEVKFFLDKIPYIG